MLNIFKAECYRLLKGKTFYITLFCLLGFGLMTVLTQSTGSVGVNTTDLASGLEGIEWSGSQIPDILNKSLNILQYFFLPILVVVMGTEFNYLTYKNTISKGLSRSKYYLIKLGLVFIVCFVYAALYMLVSTGVGTLIYGFKGTITFTYLKGILTPFLLQLFIMFALISIASTILFITKKTTACTIGYLVIPMIIQLIVALALEGNPSFGELLMKYEVISAMPYIAYGLLEYSSTHYLMVSCGYILVSSILGFYLFNRLDLK